MFGGEPPHNVNDHVGTTAAGILNNVASVATSLGSNVGWYMSQSQLLVVLGPEHAATIAADGFTRADVQRFVFEHARLPLGRLKLGGMWGIHDWPLWMHKVTDEAVLLPRVPSADDVLRDGGRRAGQALRGGAQLHLQPRGVARGGSRRLAAGRREPRPARAHRLLDLHRAGARCERGGHDGCAGPGGHDLPEASP